MPKTGSALYCQYLSMSNRATPDGPAVRQPVRLMSGQVAVESFFSPPGTQNWEPLHNPVAMAPAATTTSSGT